MSGERLTLWWVDRYTRGVPEPEREARRAEIESDIWEHTAALDGRRVGLALASRCARGIPADLSWRRSRRRGRRSLPSRGTVARGIGWALAGAAYAFLVLTHGLLATALVGFDLYGEDWAPGDVESTSRFGGLMLGLLVAGALLLPRAPRIGGCLLVVASIATATMFWWALPILGPIGLAVTAGAVVLARRRRRTLQARASSATS